MIYTNVYIIERGNTYMLWDVEEVEPIIDKYLWPHELKKVIDESIYQEIVNNDKRNFKDITVNTDIDI